MEQLERLRFWEEIDLRWLVTLMQFEHLALDAVKLYVYLGPGFTPCMMGNRTLTIILFEGHIDGEWCMLYM